MNWLSDYILVAGLAFYWGSILLALLAPLFLLYLIALGICKGVAHMAPSNVVDRAMDNELRRMLDESR